MGTIRVLTEADLRKAVGFGEEEIRAIESVYPLISSGAASMPPIMRIDVPDNNGEIDVKSAYLPGYSGIAVKVSAGFFDNPEKGLPSLGGLMMVFDSETGIPQSALFDNGFLTDLRTALAGAVAAKHLSVTDASKASILGAGVQAGLQLEAMTMVRPIRQAIVWSRRREQAEAFAGRFTAALGIPVAATGSPAEAVAGADVVVTTTPSTAPLLEASMLHHGIHITAIGSDAETKQELSVDVLETADLVVCDSLAQSRRLGELRAAVEMGVELGAVELGQIVSGEVSGRTSSDSVTVCDLTGTGAQDTAIASLAGQRCLELGLGTAIET